MILLKIVRTFAALTAITLLLGCAHKRSALKTEGYVALDSFMGTW